jgi:hypothetical protein
VEGDESAETFLEGRRPARSVKNWVFAADRLPGVSEATCRQRIVNESTEPLVGRLGDEVRRTARASRISRVGGIEMRLRVGRMGPIKC